LTAKGGLKMKTKNKKVLTPAEQEAIYTRDFLDQICPGDIKFYADHYICGSTFRSVWAIREYSPTTEEQAILRHLGEKSGVTLRIYTRFVTALEQRKIIQNAARKNLLKRGGTQDMQENVIAESNLQDVANLLATTHRNKEPLLHTAVFVELTAPSLDALRELQAGVEMELTRSKINIDKLLLRQKEGFVSVMPCGYNVFGVQFERVLPASSAANLYPLCYSGRTDPHGFPIGKDKCGTHIIVDFMRRESDKTNSNILILGNSGQGKSFLIKLINTILREGDMNLIILDAEEEYIDLTRELGGCHLDLMSGQYLINVLEPRVWGSDDEDEGKPAKGILSEHISFLREFFGSYKDFTDRHLDTLEIVLQRLYRLFGISDQTDMAAMTPARFPILKDLYDLLEKEFMEFDDSKKHLYTEELLQDLCLGLHSICVGTDSKYFNGHTNITSDRVLCFGVKTAMEANASLKNVMLFNVLSYMSGALLGDGNTAAVIDELYLWLSNLPAVERIRNAMKRVRKKNSAIIIASQNLNDYLLPDIAELTKPLFAIPAHTFLFNPGAVDKRFYIENLQLEPSEYDLIKLPQQGLCLYKCGNQRYHLEVQAPDYKAVRFGKAGGI
jgi:type IV secretory pathway VirB4 component